MRVILNAARFRDHLLKYEGNEGAGSPCTHMHPIAFRYICTSIILGHLPLSSGTWTGKRLVPVRERRSRVAAAGSWTTIEAHATSSTSRLQQ